MMHDKLYCIHYKPSCQLLILGSENLNVDKSKPKIKTYHMITFCANLSSKVSIVLVCAKKQQVK